MDGFTLHAATRAGALDARGREALLRYVLRPPIAQDRIEHGQDGMVRIVLKRPFPDGTVTVEMDPLSLLCRLAASVPPPRHHRQVRRRARGASEWRSRIVPPSDDALAPERPGKKKRRRRYRTWAELLARTFGLDSLACPVCRGRMRLVAVLRNPARIARYLASIGEPTELPKRSPKQGPALLEEPHPAPDGHRPRRRLSGSAAAHHLKHRKRDGLSGPGEGLSLGPTVAPEPFPAKALQELSGTAVAPASAPEGTSRRRRWRPNGACITYALSRDVLLHIDSR
jgi:hypothetical protein